MHKVTHKGVYGIIFKNEKILLVKKQRGPFIDKWDLPGGGIEKGENTLETLKREVIEESGYIVIKSKLIDVRNDRIEYKNNKGQLEELTLISIIYLAHLEEYENNNKERIIREIEDVSDSQWINIYDARNLPFTPNVKFSMEWIKRNKMIFKE